MIKDVTEGDYFTLSPKKGYTEQQCKDAMQVMECWGDVMCVIAGNGACMICPYDHFEKVDISKHEYKNVYEYPYEFKDNRI